MSDVPDPDATVPAAAGDRPLGRSMARGTVAQQGGTVAAIIVGLINTTALGRSLSLAEFGVYGFVVALASYLYFVAGTVETAAINEMAAATTRDARDAAFTRSIIVYAGLGAVAAGIIAVGGALLVGVLDIPSSLRGEARAGAVAVGGLTTLGWIGKVFQDLLRATHRFSAAAASEAIGSILLCGAVLLTLAVDAPLWCTIAAGAAIPLYVGVVAIVIVTVTDVGWTLRLRDVHRGDLRRFLVFSGGIFGISTADLMITSLDRLIVGALRPAPTLGLYEGAFRLNLLIRMWAANFSVTLLPVLTSLRAENQKQGERDMLLLGTRYVLPAIVGPTVTLMVLSDRVLAVWLGERFAEAAPAAVVFLAWWLIAPNLSIAQTMLMVERRLRPIAIYAWLAAIVNLLLSIALTAWLGLIGVAIGTTVGYLAATPYFVSFAFRGRGISVGEFARSVWAPAYSAAIVLALLLLAVRLAVPLDHTWSVGLVCVVAVLGYWGVIYTVALKPEERLFFRSVARRS